MLKKCSKIDLADVMNITGKKRQDSDSISRISKKKVGDESKLLWNALGKVSQGSGLSTNILGNSKVTTSHFTVL